MVVDSHSDPLAPALEQCAAEPIHIPGGIQSFTVLLAAQEDGSIIQCSANTARLFGREPREVLALNLSSLLPNDIDRIIAKFATMPAGKVESLEGVCCPAGKVSACLHHHLGRQIIEFISPLNALPVASPLPEDGVALAMQSLAESLTEGATTEDFCSTVVARFRELTGYDRVMVYRFDTDWNGAVIAESRDDSVESYLGQQFPASDIPPQARALYLRSAVRILADAYEEPVPLVSKEAKALDLTFAVSRAMSPIHREYLHNMGVRGTLVASIVRDGQLWGMLTCHHNQPLLPSRSWLTLAVAFAKLIATQVEMQEGGSRSRGVTSAQRLLSFLPRLLSVHGHLGEGLIDPRTGLVEVLGANGVAVLYRGGWGTRGITPGREDLTALATWLQSRNSPTFVTDRLGEERAEFAHLGSVCPGVLAMQIPNTLDGWILWFRVEHAETVTWAGDYRNGLTVEGTSVRLSPRKSFKAWVAVVRGRSRPWAQSELVVADEVIRPYLLEVMATVYQQQSQLLRRYQQILFEQVHDAVIVTDLDGVVTFWNDGAQRTLGWRTEEMVGQHITARLAVPDRPQVLELLRSVQAGGTFTGRYRDTHKDGRTVWLDIRLCRIRDEMGIPIGIMAASRDVTGEKATEDRLRLKRAIVRHSRDAVLVADSESRDLANLRVVYVNPAFISETGHTEEEVIGQLLVRFLAVDANSAVSAQISESLQAWAPCRVESILPRKNGTSYWVELDFVPLPDDDGQYSRWIVVLRNIGDRKAAEASLRASEELFRSAFESSGIGMAMVGLDGRFLRVNPALAKMLGRAPDEFIGNTHGAFTHPEDLSVDLEFAAEAVAGRRNVYEIEQRYLTADSGVVWVILTAALIRDESGAPVYFIRQVQDVTDRRQAEQRAREAWNVFTRGPAVLVRWGVEPSYRVVEMTDSIRQFGFAPEDFTSGRRSWLEVMHPGDRDRFVRAVEDARVMDRQSLELRYRIVTPSGDVRWLFDHTIQVYDDLGVPTFADGYLLDVTDLRRAEDALRASEERLRTITDNLPDGTVYRYVLQPDGFARFVYIGEGIERLLGVSVANILASPEAFSARTVPEDRRKVELATFASLADLSVFSCEFRVETLGGELRWLHCRSAPHKQPDGTVVWDGVVMDVTFRKAAEIHLAEREQFLMALFRGCPIGIAVFAPQGATQRTNPAMRALLELPGDDTRLPQIDALRDLFILHAPLADAFRLALSGDVASLAEYPLELSGLTNDRPREKSVWVDCTFFAIQNGSGEVEQVVLFVVDATARVTARLEKERLEQASQQSQKLDAIGQLAGGIAHDFNNILTGVRVFADLLLDDMKAGDEGRELALEIRKAAERGANLTRRLLSFSRKQIVQPTIIDVNALILDMGEMLRRLLDQTIRVVTNLAPDAPPVRADKGQVEQIILNLSLNARDAMPKGGRLNISTARVREPDQTAGQAEPRVREFLRLSVTDTGTGMTDDVKSRLFEPFFTTKPVGRGTGLGLATVYGIARQAGGSIQVETQVGRGSAFHVILPSTDPPTPQLAESNCNHEPSHFNRASILVVDDDAMIRKLADLVLRRAGHRVVTAESAAEVLAMTELQLHRVELLLTDVVMPGLSGRELVEQLVVQYPALRVGYLSGYTADTMLRHGIHEDGVAFLQKPFSEEQLLQFVTRCLCLPESKTGASTL